MKLILSCLTIFVALFPASLRADQGFTVQAGVSTLGATIQPGYRVGRYFGISLPMGYASAEFSGDIDGIGYDAALTTGGIGVLADLYLGDSGWHLSGGALLGNYKADLSFDDTITIDGATFNDVDIRANVSPALAVSPMATFGYTRHFANSWGISANIGAIYTGGLALGATDESGQIDQGDLDDYLSDFADTLGQIGVIPYVKISVSVAF